MEDFTGTEKHADANNIPDSIPRPNSVFVRFSNECDWCYTGTVESDADIENLWSNALIEYRQHLIYQNEQAYQTLHSWNDWSPDGQRLRARISAKFWLSRNRLRTLTPNTLSLHVWSWGQWVTVSPYYQHHLRNIRSPFERCVKQVRWGKCLASLVQSIITDIEARKR
jgi:hypothetical protein